MLVHCCDVLVHCCDVLVHYCDVLVHCCDELVHCRDLQCALSSLPSAVVFVYDYHPGAETLYSRHLQQGRRAGWLPEDLVWEYVIQLVSLLQVVHSSGLAFRCIDSTKVLVTGRKRFVRAIGRGRVTPRPLGFFSLSPRLRVNCGGMMDILTFGGPTSSSSSLPALPQQEDLVAVGQLVLTVALQSPAAAEPGNYHHSLDTLATHYSPDLHNITQ